MSSNHHYQLSVIPIYGFYFIPSSFHSHSDPNSKIKKLPQLSRRILRTGNRVADSPGVLVNLVVVAALEGLVAKEVDGGVLDAVGLLGLVLEVLQAVGLVPAGGEDVEGDLAADGEAVRFSVSVSWLYDFGKKRKRLGKEGKN